MIDTLIIHIPLHDEYFTVNGHLHSIVGDIADFQVKAVPSYLKRDPITRVETVGELYNPFEKLPTSISSMAMKFYAVNVANTKPYVAINASAKLLQGHNVYGGESVLNLAAEMLALLKDCYPFFYDTLNIADARISKIDTTFSVRLSSEALVQPALRFLKNADTGQRKADNRRDFHNTVYFGSATSPYGGAKIYGKAYELNKTIKKYKDKASKGDLQSAKMLDILNPDLLAYSQGLLRFECSTKARQLEKFNLPKNLWAFIDYQLNVDRLVITKLWRTWFDPILSTLKGDIMPDVDDSEVYDLCRSKLVTFNQEIKRVFVYSCPYFVTGLFCPMFFVKTGKPSYVKAHNAYNFYKLLKVDGWDKVKSRYSPNAFNTAVRGLVFVGYGRAVLKNLATDVLPTVPVGELITLDFKGQYPDGYTPVISKHIHSYIKFIKRDNIPSLMFPTLYGLDGKLLPLPKLKKAKYK